MPERLTRKENYYSDRLGIPVVSNAPPTNISLNSEEVDELWDKLSEGGRKDRCGWLQDKFGLSWQVIPSALPRLLGDKDPKKANRVMAAMMQMDKIDIAGLQEAYDAA
jgi:predicted 3-demethylubiquinone-9 3-methyltransferase (glyoxalase superfamily)